MPLGKLSLLGRAADFRLLFLATLGSGVGTYLAAIALTVDIYQRTDSGAWIAALLIADFLPMIVIGLTLGPLVDRLSRRGLMIGSDVVRLGVFCALPFVDSPAGIVVLAGIAGVATGFFRPAVYAGLPNLVEDDDLTAANSLLLAVENAAWMAGPVFGGVLLAASGPDLAYWINAVTFLVSVVLLLRIPARRLQSEQALTKGHWRDVLDGLDVVRSSRALLAVLVVWNLVMLGIAGINVAEVFLARESLDSGNVGLGILIGASGLGLTLGSLVGGPVLDARGVRFTYAGSIAVMSVGYLAAAISPNVWVASAAVIVATAGNGVALVCNSTLVQRGAPDQLRGRAFTVIMSSNYALLGLGMALAGPLTSAVGGRWMWGVAGAIMAGGAGLSLALTRGVEVSTVSAEPDATEQAPVQAEPEPREAAAH